MYETSTDFLLFLVSVIRSEIRWAKQVQDMLVSPVFCKAVDIIFCMIQDRFHPISYKFIK